MLAKLRKAVSRFFKPNPHLMTLEFTNDILKRMDDLRKELPGNPENVEIIRRAMTVYDFCVMQEARGNKIVIQYPDGEVQDFDINPDCTGK